MSDRNGPWQQDPETGSSAWGLILWLALLVAIGIGIWMLSARFPDALSDGYDQGQLVYLVVILAMVSLGVIAGQRYSRREVVRNIAGWGVVALVLALGFTYQDDLRSIALRVRGELIPGYGVSTDPNVFVLTEAGGGHFLVTGEANGVPVQFLVDTGASEIVLSPEDARRLGIDPDSLNYTRVYSTANGSVRGAPYNLASLKIGPIELSNVAVSINQAEMDGSLLGMTFLNRLESFEFRGRQLILRTR